MLKHTSLRMMQTRKSCICGNWGGLATPRFPMPLSASHPLSFAPPRCTGRYAYNVSVPGGSSCVASFNVTPCPPATLTCAPARVVALTPATSCLNVGLPVSSFYNVTAPGDIPAVVIVYPPLPTALTFGPGELGARACRGVPFQGGAKGPLRRGRAVRSTFPLQTLQPKQAL